MFGVLEVTIPARLQDVLPGEAYSLRRFGRCQVDDGNGGTDTDTVTVTVVDTASPILTLANTSVEVTATTPGGGAVVDVIAASGATASEVCDSSPAITHDAPAEFPTGVTVVTITAQDASGNSDSQMFSVTVVPVDLDIAQFRVTNRVDVSRGGSVDITLVVRNNGTVDDVADATVIGMQGVTEVYNETLSVSDPPGNGRTTFNFLSFMPAVAGDITWTATIADRDPDLDEDSAVTRVVP